MISKVKIPKTALTFIIDKTADYIINRISKRVDDHQSKSTNLSSIEYERELRNGLSELKDKINNLEAVIYQGKRLYEMTVSQLINIEQPNINVYGNLNINITANIYYTGTGIRINGNNTISSLKDINNIVDYNAKNLFYEYESNITSELQKKIAKEFSNIILNGQNRLFKLRQGEDYNE